MKTPEEKYFNDSHFRHLVDLIEGMVHEAKFTPSEIREAAILACIHYEMKSIRSMQFLQPTVVSKELEDAMNSIEKFTKKIYENF